MTNLYYSFTVQQYSTPIPDVVWEKPIPLIKDIASHYKNYPNFKRLMMCPSFRDSVNNTYVIKSPIDMDFTWDQDSTPIIESSSDRGGRLISHDLYPHMELFIDNQPLFIADSSLTMKVLPPFMHEDSPRYPFLGGQLDVGKWYRPVHPTFLMHRGECLNIKRGQAMMYVQFDKKVTLKRFRYTPELDRELKGLIDARTFLQVRSMKDCYDFLAKSNRKKFVFNEIKKNLL